MPRKRSGSLTFRRGRYWALVTIGKKGESERRWIDLRTADELEATRKKDRYVADILAGRLVPSARTQGEALVTVKAFAKDWLEAREAEGVVMVKDERSSLLHVYPLIGDRPISEIEPADIEQVFAIAYEPETGLSHSSISHIRALLSRLFRAAVVAGHLRSNPVEPARTPRRRVSDVVRERSVLTDAEFQQFALCPLVPPQFRLMAVLARFVGGMRSGDVNALQWKHVDVAHFAWAIVLRGKTRKPQQLALPAQVGPWLATWFEELGKPDPEAFVFDVLRPENYRPSHAEDLRYWLHVARVARHECTRKADAPAPKKDGTCCPAMAADPLFTDLERTSKVDWHSFRRAFASGLARAGVDERTALLVTAHTTSTVHRRYLSSDLAMRALPSEAFPILNKDPRNADRFRNATRASRKAKDSAPPDRFERSTNGLEGRCSIQLSYGGRRWRRGYPSISSTMARRVAASKGLSIRRFLTSSRKARVRGVKAPPVAKTMRAACSGTFSTSAT